MPSVLFRTRDGRARWWIVAVLLVAMMPMLTGCYGRFPLTKAVYKFNGEVSDNKFIQSVVMWVLVIIPVYGLATFGDAVVINLIEFWTGKPLNVASTTDENGTTVALQPSADGREAALTLSRNGHVLAKSTFVRTSASEIEVRDTDGRLVGKVLRAPDGGLRLTDANGLTIRTIAASVPASAGAM